MVLERDIFHQELSDLGQLGSSTVHHWQADIEVKMAWWWWTPVICLVLYLLLNFSPKFNYFAKFTYLYLAYIFLRYFQNPNLKTTQLN